MCVQSPLIQTHTLQIVICQDLLTQKESPTSTPANHDIELTLIFLWSSGATWGLEDTKINQRDFTDPSFPFEKKKRKKTNTQIIFALAEIEITLNQVI